MSYQLTTMTPEEIKMQHRNATIKILNAKIYESEQKCSEDHTRGLKYLLEWLLKHEDLSIIELNKINNELLLYGTVGSAVSRY
jgi:hypothetical protein